LKILEPSVASNRIIGEKADNNSLYIEEIMNKIMMFTSRASSYDCVDTRINKSVGSIHMAPYGFEFCLEATRIDEKQISEIRLFVEWLNKSKEEFPKAEDYI
jgi:hypothetical protein